LATTNGLRMGRTRTVVPKPTRVVHEATQESATRGSNTYADGGYSAPVGTARWSLTQTSA